jgi:hypothetical protein
MKEKKQNKKELINSQLDYLPKATDNYAFYSQRANKGWLVYATDSKGVVTALTYVPE